MTDDGYLEVQWKDGSMSTVALGEARPVDSSDDDDLDSREVPPPAVYPRPIKSTSLLLSGPPSAHVVTVVEHPSPSSATPAFAPARPRPLPPAPPPPHPV
eukprot:Sspe_Gene.527::Locus_178_Transcript_1_1_Confidence_1.000_Length_964::g.527::m.527